MDKLHESWMIFGTISISSKKFIDKPSKFLTRNKNIFRCFQANANYLFHRLK